ncbi:MAG TPA: T9SS type A sorting domain-containing protein [Bacteroidales bacterium]|nr:T9SS type A sorting domain-containing protein [Bacteroidales bacterium]HCI55110.1 hypothetical protein [Bacteroidales bacterium]HOU96716.1 T9SS type A sorting domain-containing protein [Bacteroidales bacterium]HQG35857.1 T9SS type A sorting domain-containing protein [Bacteroidales bacterium]HQG52367.1 T9SS type A sorting domain-containing protein [Bacteroidales bacterium]
MKRCFLVIQIMFFILSVSGQEKQDVIASAGGYDKSSDNSISISWTLGETIIQSYKSNDGQLIIDYGFQQKLIITAIEENLEVPIRVTIYPNPTSESVKIKFESAVDRLIDIQIIDGQGRLIKTDRIEESIIEKTLNLQDLPSGTYYLRLLKGNVANVYKIVKL